MDEELLKLIEDSKKAVAEKKSRAEQIQAERKRQELVLFEQASKMRMLDVKKLIPQALLHYCKAEMPSFPITDAWIPLTFIISAPGLNEIHFELNISGDKIDRISADTYLDGTQLRRRWFDEFDWSEIIALASEKYEEIEKQFESGLGAGKEKKADTRTSADKLKDAIEELIEMKLFGQ